MWTMHSLVADTGRKQQCDPALPSDALACCERQLERLGRENDAHIAASLAVLRAEVAAAAAALTGQARLPLLSCWPALHPQSIEKPDPSSLHVSGRLACCALPACHRRLPGHGSFALPRILHGTSLPCTVVHADIRAS